MTKDTMRRYRKRLLDYSERARGAAEGLEKQTRIPTGGEAVGNLSNAPMHLGDVGTEMYTQELNATLLEHEELVMSEIADAIVRLDRGTYGTCENCGKEIPDGRLEAIPYARYCIPCVETRGDEPAANMNAGRPEAPRGSYAPRQERRPTAETSDTDLVNGDRPAVADMESDEDHPDVHAVGTAGGGTAVGGLAGTNIGDGAPTGAGLEDAMGSGNFDSDELDAEDTEAYAGAAGGTPAGKRSRGGRTHRGLAPQSDADDSPTGP